MNKRLAVALLGCGVAFLVVAAVLFIVLGHDSGISIDSGPFNADRSPASPSPTDALVVERAYPTELERSQSRPVRLSLLLGQPGGPAFPEPTGGVRDNPLPLAGFVVQSATAELLGASFAIDPGDPRAISADGRDRLDWEWSIAPTEEGEQVATLSIDVELVNADGTVIHDGWVEPLHIEVDDGESLPLISRIPILSMVTALMGSALSIPFFYTLWKDRKPRHSSPPAPQLSVLALGQRSEQFFRR